MSNELQVVGEAGAGKLYVVNGFLIPVVSGSGHEMGNQYGESRDGLSSSHDPTSTATRTRLERCRRVRPLTDSLSATMNAHPLSYHNTA